MDRTRLVIFAAVAEMRLHLTHATRTLGASLTVPLRSALMDDDETLCDFESLQVSPVTCLLARVLGARHR